MGISVGLGVAVGLGLGVGLLQGGGVGGLVAFCGAVGAAAGVALSGKPVAEVVARSMDPASEEAAVAVPVPVSPQAEMVAIPGGTFWMGSAAGDEDADEDEQPRHQVTLSPFWMAKVPVTREFYQEVTGTSPGTHGEGANLPINNVSWIDAIRFCNRWSELEGLTPAYVEKKAGEFEWIREANGYRLPTEAEWEYAARGTDERPYPWGRKPPSNQLCWDGPGNDLGQGNRDAPSPVGSYPAGASPFGLLDMAGNVWEWCWDRYDRYEATPAQNPIGSLDGNTRVLRGGSWVGDGPSGVRAAYRFWFDASRRLSFVGFRCARGPNQ